MPGPERADPTVAIVGLFRAVHERVRAALDQLDDTGLTWVPTVGANSVATIVTHLVGSERETLECVAGRPSERHRAAEFEPRSHDRRSLTRAVDEADALLAELAGHVDEDRLWAEVSLPTLAADLRRPGWSWLVENLGHAREHLGHIELTGQLYRQRGDGRQTE